MEVLNEINHNENNGIINILDSYKNYPNIENDLWYVVPQGIPCKKYLAHRDIKPENIVWDTNKKRFVFIDFGIAKHQDYEIEHNLNLTEI